MHKQLWNALKLEVEIEPRSPILIKSGTLSPNPSLPDMQFVRTMTSHGEKVFIPGSSIKGVFRGFSEKVLRTISSDLACEPFPSSKDYCAKKGEIKDEKDTAKVYQKSCLACKIYGNTRLKGRLSFTDAFPDEDVKTETRYGVAISRLTNAVAAGPFDIEVLVQGSFKTSLVLENFEVWHIGLVSLTLQALDEGLVKIGFGKNRGFGDVSIKVMSAIVELAKRPGIGKTDIWGIGSYVSGEESARYGLHSNDCLREVIEPIEEKDFAVLLRRTYNKDQWKSIADKAIETLAGLTEIMQ
ncbi:RAMP superfamily CRISPR-associated protein [Acetomicrobium hydrogeniformans]|jgi:CRISPR-associated RAMP protein (TIGR02581 family)|uniref:CRISPR-associated RAMP protein, SSO1426 family n=1 Tax=Acetomicrobium hydrogeniformans ATCC BAA-1850 TaxID=592015 RepID=A0A0T5X8S3_9BACT|nr:RAMP superfamily CRISPR-associated protein [Acetomicrobium hydrogeniformans]KRT34761.1 CRISPR-associated RAMP protein, SSO1426 family [Acetomicrobium hydrogeniformans ATCC BAA-1850]